jgi:glucose-1-phosphate thymidylyltransferase
MKVLILAAGYATRLYPLTLKKAKPLLEVGGKPMIEWVVDNMAAVPAIRSIYVVSNAKFAGDFQNWAHAYQERHPHLEIRVINDGSTNDDDKLGAIGDIHLALTREDLFNDDLLIVAGDNLFTEPLGKFVEFAAGTEATVGVYDVGDREAIKKYGAVEVDDCGVITRFEEKPANPTTTLAAIALYYYSREVLPLFTTYIAAGNNPDQPGRFLQWLYPRKPVHTFQITGRWVDIGSKETLESTNKILSQ